MRGGEKEQALLSPSLQKRLSRLASSTTLAHLFIFVSPSAEVASTVARSFLLDWLGASSMMHPDLLEIVTTGKIGLHSVASIRGVLDQLALTPHGGKGRAVLIEDADKMLPQGANALLKALEEPPSRTLIVLSTSSPHRILPTIFSRAQTIRIPFICAQEMQVVQPLLDHMAVADFSYTAMKEICDGIQSSIEHDLSLFAKQKGEILSKGYSEVTPCAKQEFQQEIDANLVHEMQSRSKRVLELVYLAIRNSVYNDNALRLLLEAIRGIDTGSELSQMLLWFVTGLGIDPKDL
jgi:hypothetical protein